MQYLETRSRLLLFPVPFSLGKYVAVKAHEDVVALVVERHHLPPVELRFLGKSQKASGAKNAGESTANAEIDRTRNEIDRVVTTSSFALMVRHAQPPFRLDG